MLILPQKKVITDKEELTFLILLLVFYMPYSFSVLHFLYYYLLGLHDYFFFYTVMFKLFSYVLLCILSSYSLWRLHLTYYSYNTEIWIYASLTSIIYKNCSFHSSFHTSFGCCCHKITSLYSLCPKTEANNSF